MMLRTRLLLAAGVATLAVMFQISFSAANIAEPELLPPQSAPQTAVTVTGDCCAPVPVCCPKPCITYRHRGPKLCCGCCLPPVETVLKVKNPCTCCETDIPVCLPGCCTGEPTICCGSGFLGRDVVEYEWCCGFRVRIAFKRCGDLLVTTWGR
jgi:hypothetical protein